MMPRAAGDFRLDATEVQSLLDRARQRAETPDLAAVLAHARSGGGMDAADAALLWASRISSAEMYELACAARAARPVRLETFSPLYLTNTCDAECRMCGMRRDNRALVRETADLEAIDAQLHLLRRRGMHAVALLT